MAMPLLEVEVTVDDAELRADVERIARGELGLPTVSAIRLRCADGPLFMDAVVPVYLTEEDFK